MAVPTYDQFIEPILRCLASRPEGAPAKVVHDFVADLLGLSAADRQELLPSGVQPVFKNRAGWAHDRLKRAGLSTSPRRGYWQLTDEGIAFIHARPRPFSPDEVEHLTSGFKDVRLRDSTLSEPGESSLASSTAVADATRVSPDERLDAALLEIRASVTRELVEALERVSPAYFEVIVLDLLHKLGYGTSRADIQRLGRSGDEGIDGVIALDRLGLDKVYVQAKKWKDAVGRPEVQAFYGALAGQRAKRGVLITTSRFTNQAEEFARSVEGIVLVNGVRLAQLMVDHEVGVSSKIVRLPRLDSDYFDEADA
jgi:restriction system protein